MWGCFPAGVSHIAQIGDVWLVGSAPGGTQKGLLRLVVAVWGGLRTLKGGKDPPNFESAMARKGHRRCLHLKPTKPQRFCPRSCPVVVAISKEK